ncbi:MAG TPA: hypothetical protein VLZ83_05355 [Edaphocola sp.]|nr:hypothetical protein [Edaphocola sp.]
MAYNFYPFGMLMPGRYTSDTNRRCLLVSRSTWTTTMVDSCYSSVQLTGTASVLGVASYSSSGGTFAAAAPSATDAVVLNQTVASGIDNVLTFDMLDLRDGDKEVVLVTVLETIDNVPYVIGGRRLRQGKDQRISFRSTGNNIQVVLNGPYSNLILAQICTRYARSNAQTYLVEVCDESNDRYRFGFNGQEKVNEIAGVGNHNTAEFWEYDTRLGRRWNLDPIVKPWESGYAVYRNSPIAVADPDGQDGVVTSGSGTETDPLVIKAHYITNGLNEDEQSAFGAAIKQYYNGGNSWKIGIEDGKNIYVRFELTAEPIEGNLTKGDLSSEALLYNMENSDKVSTNFYGNYVQRGTVVGDHFASATNLSIDFDAKKMDEYVKKYSSGSEQGDKYAYSQLLISTFVHEIGHTLGAVHKDPGEIMEYQSNNRNPDSRSNTGSVSSIGNGGSNSGYKITQLSRVTADGIRAIIGRIGLKGNPEQHKYLSPKEMKSIRKNGEDSRQNGQITIPK